MPAKSRSQQELLAYWLRGFADGEGSVSVAPATVRIANTELVLLETAQGYLAALGITARIGQRRPPANPRWSQAWELHVCGRENLRRWQQLIGFTSPAKQEKLARALASYKRPRLPQQEIIDAYCKGDSTLQIAKRYGVTHGAIEYRLKKYGVRARDYSQAAILQWRKQKGA